MLTSRKNFKINETKVMHETIEGEVILIHMDSGNYYSIDLVGADVWNLISNKMTTDQIIADILLRYEGKTDVVDENVCTFLSQLEKEDLIVHDEVPMPSSTTTVHTNTPPFQQEKPAFTPPTLEVYSDMQDLLLLDPIHEVDETGWPSTGAK